MSLLSGMFPCPVAREPNKALLKPALLAHVSDRSAAFDGFQQRVSRMSFQAALLTVLEMH